jgi:hypothetical protein
LENRKKFLVLANHKPGSFGHFLWTYAQFHISTQNHPYFARKFGALKQMAALQVFPSHQGRMPQSNPKSTMLIHLQRLGNVIWGKGDDQLSIRQLWRGRGLFQSTIAAFTYRLDSIPPEIKIRYQPNTSGIWYDRLQWHTVRTKSKLVNYCVSYWSLNTGSRLFRPLSEMTE